MPKFQAQLVKEMMMENKTKGWVASNPLSLLDGFIV